MAALAVSACAENPHHQSTTFLDQNSAAEPKPANFRECHGFARTNASRVSLSPKEWQRVAAIFKPAAKDARSERRQVSHALVVMHRLVGAQTGTAVHQWTHKDSDILPNLSDPTQLDCIDEAVNTWTYMTMMEKSGFFRFHRVAKLSNAGGLATPRNTAVIEEKSGGLYAVDPSLVDFDQPPPVIPVAAWMGDWPPDLSANDAAPVMVAKKTPRKGGVKMSAAATRPPVATAATP